MITEQRIMYEITTTNFGQKKRERVNNRENRIMGPKIIIIEKSGLR